jgi:hypothetical protein
MNIITTTAKNNGYKRKQVATLHEQEKEIKDNKHT